MPTLIMVVLQLIGLGIVWAVFTWGSTDDYDLRIAVIKAGDLHWPVLAIALYHYMVIFLNVYPMVFKERCMGKGNVRANLFIYRLAAEEPNESSAVVLHEDGELGKYNRANRSIHHYLENANTLLLSAPLCYYVCPFPTFVVILASCAGRILH